MPSTMDAGASNSLSSSLWIPNDPMMNGYMEFARIISVLFLMYQDLLILVLACNLNDTLVNNFEKEGGSATSYRGIILIIIFLVVTEAILLGTSISSKSLPIMVAALWFAISDNKLLPILLLGPCYGELPGPLHCGPAN